MSHHFFEWYDTIRIIGSLGLVWEFRIEKNGKLVMREEKRREEIIMLFGSLRISGMILDMEVIK